jgi:peptidoglycan L-alanyl-D-glutamate endopeptidase CwlK
MTRDQLRTRDELRLVGVHPELAAKARRILAALEALGVPMCITDALRTVADQQAKFAQGRTAPGAIVTRCDGVLKKSNHQAHDDGYGHAIDCAFLISHDGGTTFQPTWDEAQPWAAYGACVEALGLTWGGGESFRRAGLVDKPHAELP